MGTLNPSEPSKATTEGDPTARLMRLTWWVTAAGVLAVGAVAVAQGPGRSSLAEPVAPPADASFWNHWGDGKAEIDAYRLVQPRYGAKRNGTIVHIFVTEPFSVSKRVKADRTVEGDTVQVLKLNEVRDFQTGIYDYNMMTSVFVPVQGHPDARVGAPLKVSFSSQEWCGVMFEELNLRGDRFDQQRFSYFEGESESGHVVYPPEGILIDELPIRVRGLLTGGPRSLAKTEDALLLPSLTRARLTHKPLAWEKAKLRVSKSTSTIKVPAGAFETYTVKAGVGSETYEYEVEAAYPHRIVRWTGPEGETAELLGSKRLPYWSLNGLGQEAVLRQLGLRVPEGN